MYYYIIWLASISFITFILYGLDKTQSKRNGWRVPEMALHVLALAGGFMGGWAGCSLFHHKTKKGMFVLVLILSTVIHLGIIYLSFTTSRFLSTYSLSLLPRFSNFPIDF
jgi:uncharacterized membrane protein YsdA (DUF1294 family)